MLLGPPCGRCSSGRCAFFLYIALLVDAGGLILLLVGIFAPLSSWDFFVYTGALILALSLLFWLAWYTLNIDVPPEQNLWAEGGCDRHTAESASGAAQELRGTAALTQRTLGTRSPKEPRNERKRQPYGEQQLFV
ncbi:transmembrane protein 238-like [Rhynchocyon petersi]